MMKKVLVFLTVIALLTVGLLLPAAAVAGPANQANGLPLTSSGDPAMPLDGTWQVLDEVMPVGGYFTGPWTWTSAFQVKFTITDLFVVTDRFKVYDFGAFVIETPNMPDWDVLGLAGPFTSPPWTNNPDVALADGRFSSAVIQFGAGSYSIDIQDIHIPPVSVGGGPFADGTVAFKAEIELSEVDIDIKPGSYPNSINLKNKGVVPVALLGSDTFDVAMVDVDTLMFAPAGSAWLSGATPAHAEVHYEDVDMDGYMDLVSHYRTQDTCIQSGDEEAYLYFMADGVHYLLSDSIRTLH